MLKKMNKESYLKELKRCIQALPVDEQNEAMDYYRDYFDDAGDDNKVIEELGDPEKLAEEIKAKFACVPATKEAESTGSKDDAKNDDQQSNQNKSRDNYNRGYNYSDVSAMKFSFDADKVKNMDLQLGAAEILMVVGSKYAVETRGIDRTSFRCELSPQGTLIIDSTRRLPSWSFFSHDNPRIRHPRVLLTVPENAVLDIFKLRVGAGAFKTRDVLLRCNSASLDVAAGQLIMGRIHGGRIDLRCGMGELKMYGSVKGVTNIDCGMGNIELDLVGNPAEYSIDAKVGLGEVSFNNQRKSGLGDMLCSTRMINHFSVNCGMGNVAIKMNM